MNIKILSDKNLFQNIEALKFTFLALNSRITAAVAQQYAVKVLIMSILIHSPFSILNPGKAIRWSVNFELLFYLALFLIYMKSKNV